MHTETHIIIFAKAPLPGFAKTRLIPALGATGAAELARRLFYHACEQALAANLGSVELCLTPDIEDLCWQQIELPEGLKFSSQGQGDLGERMARATQPALEKYPSVLLMGTDCPDLTTSLIVQAAEYLNYQDACMAPVSDGGYALLGLTRFHQSLFDDIHWSTERVAQTTRERLHALQWTLAELAELHDIDEAEDLKFLPEAWRSGRKEDGERHAVFKIGQ